jgi:hypothetical protein
MSPIDRRKKHPAGITTNRCGDRGNGWPLAPGRGAKTTPATIRS